MEIDRFDFDVFLSYSAKDRLVVRDIALQLKANKIKVWFDEWQLAIGDSIPHKIELGLESSRVLILCMSRNSFDSDWASIESGTFRFRDPLNKGRRFLPLRLDDAVAPGSLRQLLSLDWTPSGREESLPKLIAACKPPPAKALGKRYSAKRAAAGRPTISSDNVLMSAFAIDKNLMHAYCGRFDGALCEWKLGDMSKGPLRIVTQAHAGQVRSVLWDQERNAILTAGSDRAVRLWNAESLVNTRTLLHSEQLSGTAWFDGVIATACQDGSIRLFNADSDECKAVLTGHIGPVMALAGSGHMLVSAGFDKTIRLWSVLSKRCLRVLEGHTETVTAIALSEDGRLLLSGSSDTLVRLWDVASGHCEHYFEGHTAGISAISWNRNQRVFLTSSEDLTVRLWDVEGKNCVKVLDGHLYAAKSLKWSDDGLHAISADASRVLSWKFEPNEVSPPKAKNTPATAQNVEKQIQYTNAKVLLVGESGAGKTGLSRRLAADVFEPSFSTLGAWATQWQLHSGENSEVEREIWLWDFGGQADQRLIHQLYMEDAALAILVFDGQKSDLFESLAQWDRDLSRASNRPFAKLLVAGRIDAGAVRATRADIDSFVKEKGYSEYLETSAKTSVGCGDLRSKVISTIDWTAIPWRSSPTLFKRLKEEIVRMKDEGKLLVRFNELRDTLKIRLGVEESEFTDAQLKAVLSLLSGPGVIVELTFGGWVLLRPELINAYGQAVIQTMRDDAGELGCVSEERVLRGDLVYHDFERIPQDEERFVLLAMQQQLLERGLCLREHVDNCALLVFPSYYKRFRPPLTGHPSVIVSYDFAGVADDIYSTLVVRLSYTKPFVRLKLWQDAADFSTASGALVGIKLTRNRGDLPDKIEVYSGRDTILADKILFIRFVHEHLKTRATRVNRRRHYVCGCGEPMLNLEAAERRRLEGKQSVGCSYCDQRIPLLDELEQQYLTVQTEKRVRGLDEQADTELDNESKERALVGEVISAVALAGQICREKSVSDHGIDMEIEFKDISRRATGELLFLQLKSGDSYLRSTSDGREVFAIRDPRHADYWMRQKVPVMLVIRDSTGVIRWMEIRSYLIEKTAAIKEKRTKGREKSANVPERVNHIVFDGEPFNTTSLLRWRKRLLGQ